MDVSEFNQKYDSQHELKEILKALGIKQKSCANYIGIPEATLARYLNAYCKMPALIEDKINELLKQLEK